jgi:hypothetical protein
VKPVIHAPALQGEGDKMFLFKDSVEKGFTIPLLIKLFLIFVDKNKNSGLILLLLKAVHPI